MLTLLGRHSKALYKLFLFVLCCPSMCIPFSYKFHVNSNYYFFLFQKAYAKANVEFSNAHHLKVKKESSSVHSRPGSRPGLDKRFLNKSQVDSAPLTEPFETKVFQFVTPDAQLVDIACVSAAATKASPRAPPAYGC